MATLATKVGLVQGAVLGVQVLKCLLERRVMNWIERPDYMRGFSNSNSSFASVQVLDFSVRPLCSLCLCGESNGAEDAQSCLQSGNLIYPMII
jgi:hypothetical protein